MLLRNKGKLGQDEAILNLTYFAESGETKLIIEDLDKRKYQAKSVYLHIDRSDREGEQRVVMMETFAKFYGDHYILSMPVTKDVINNLLANADPLNIDLPFKHNTRRFQVNLFDQHKQTQQADYAWAYRLLHKIGLNVPTSVEEFKKQARHIASPRQRI